MSDTTDRRAPAPGAGGPGAGDPGDRVRTGDPGDPGDFALRAGAPRIEIFPGPGDDELVLPLPSGPGPDDPTGVGPLAFAVHVDRLGSTRERSAARAPLDDSAVELLRASLQLTSSLQVPRALRALVESACSLTGATWGTIAVYGRSRTTGRRSRPVSAGPASASPAHLDTLLGRPRDDGVVIVNDLSATTAFTGVIEGEDPGCILSAPLRAHHQGYGRLYLCDKPGGFTCGDVTTVQTLAQAAAIAVENARLYREARSREQWMAVSQELTTLLLSGAEEDDALILVARRIREVAHADTVALILPSVGDAWACEIADGAHASELIGTFFPARGRALRTLGVAYRVLSEDEARLVAAALTEGTDAELAELERDLVLAGVVGIIDPPRPEAAVAVAEAHRAGIRVLMITGDHPDTAGRIAADLGIAERGARVLTGRELSAMDDGALAGAVARTNVYARVAPEHKMRIVGALKSQGHTVSMTGDGVNDAPALRAADIGVAMGVTGTQVTKEAAAMVLADDNFATIVDAVREGRRIFDNIKKFLRFLLSSNMGEVLTVFGGVVLAGVIGLSGRSSSGVVLPLLATQILWINLVTDSAPALAMGVDPSVEDVMGRPPRKPTDRVIDATMWSGVLLIGAVMAVSTLAVLDVFLPGGLIDIAGLSTDELPTARTAAFSTLVLAQLFNTLNSRSETVSALHHLFVNRWLWGAIALGAVLQIAVVEVPVLQVAFSTEPLDPTHWAVVVAMASLVLWVGEIRKAVRRARGL